MTEDCDTVNRRRSKNMDGHFEELVVEILESLPMKLLNVCKCVSKQWYNLISSPSFITTYIKRRKETLELTPYWGLFYQNCRYVDDTIYNNSTTIRHTVTLACSNRKSYFKSSPGFSFKFLMSSSRVPIRVLSSSNGLVLCSDTLVFQRNYYVCNPITKRLVIIPPPSAGLKWARAGFLCNCSSSNNFAVANYHGDENQKPYSVLFKSAEIYCSETERWAEHDSLDDHDGTWKQFEECMFCPCCRKSFKCSGLNAVACKGLLHWRSSGCVFVYNPSHNKNDAILTNEYSVLQLPHKRHANKAHDRYLGECKGNPMYICFDITLTFSVWELEDDKVGTGIGRWCLLHKICVDEMVFLQHDVRGVFSSVGIEMAFLAFHPFDKDVVFISLPGQILSSNLRTKTIKGVSHVGRLGVHIDSSMPYLVVLPWWPLHVSSSLPPAA